MFTFWFLVIMLIFILLSGLLFLISAFSFETISSEFNSKFITGFLVTLFAIIMGCLYLPDQYVYAKESQQIKAIHPNYTIIYKLENGNYIVLDSDGNPRKIKPPSDK